MKIFNPVFLLTTTALVAPILAAQHDKVGHKQLQKRDLVDDIHNAFNDFFNAGHDANGNTDATTTTKEKQNASSKDQPTSSDKPASSKQSDNSPPQNTDTSTDNNSTPTATQDSTSQSSPSPTSSGEKCSGNGKRCKSSQDSSYQQCMDGVWVDISCNGDSVCGKNSDGQVACVSKGQATTTYEHCSKKGDTKCSQDPSAFQLCNGNYWEPQKCGSGTTCFMDNNGKAQCGNGQGGGGSNTSYELNTPGAYVPPSGATRNLVAGSGVLAMVVVSLIWF